MDYPITHPNDISVNCFYSIYTTGDCFSEICARRNMKKVRNRYAILLCVTAAVTACGGKDNVSPADTKSQAFDDLRDEVRAVVEDPAREAQAILLVDTLEQDFMALHIVLEKRSNRTRELNADYDTTRAVFDAHMETALAELRESRRIVTKTQLALLDALSPEEREQIDRAHSKAMTATIRSMQAI
jgi:hypothetical protein